MRQVAAMVLYVAILICTGGGSLGQSGYAAAGILEELPGSYEGETLILPNEADVPFPMWTLMPPLNPAGAAQIKRGREEYWARYESMTGHTTERFEVVKQRSLKSGEDELVIRDYRDATYHISRYSEGDIYHYWNKNMGASSVYFAVFDITTDGGQKIGELALTHRDEADNESENHTRLDIDLAQSPGDFTTGIMGNEPKTLRFKYRGKYSKTGSSAASKVRTSAQPGSEPSAEGPPWKTVVGVVEHEEA